VVKIIKPEFPTLKNCHNESVTSGYDGSYVGDTNSLYSFRNYQHIEEYIYSAYPYNFYDNKSIQKSGTDWNSVQGASTGDNVLADEFYHVRVEDLDNTSNHSYIIERAFITFSLTDIPSSAELVEANIRFVIESERTDGIGTHDFVVYEGTQSSSITTFTYDEYTSDLIFGSGGTWIGNVYWKTTQSESYIENNFGNYITLALVHSLDFTLEPHDNVYDEFKIFRSGECLLKGDYSCAPVLEIVYKN
jgi:hypothetical protein